MLRHLSTSNKDGALKTLGTYLKHTTTLSIKRRMKKQLSYADGKGGAKPSWRGLAATMRAKKQHAVNGKLLTTREASEKFGIPQWYLRQYSLPYALENYPARAKRQRFMFAGKEATCEEWAEALRTTKTKFRDSVYATEKQYKCERDIAVKVAVRLWGKLKIGIKTTRTEEAKKLGLCLPQSDNG